MPTTWCDTSKTGCSKFAPAKLKTLDEVRAWFPAWLAGERAGTSGVVPRIKERYRTLPLHPVALAALAALPRAESRAFIFGRLNHPAATLRDDLNAANVTDQFTGHQGIEIPVDFHSLRRTFATTLEELGVDRAKIGACFGHRANGVTAKHYLAKNLEVVRKDLERQPAMVCSERKSRCRSRRRTST